MTLAYIGLGANLADRLGQLRWALAQLAHSPGIELRAISRFYRSAPIGPGDQPDYCNAACAIKTSLSADALLDVVQRIETSAGRVRGERWGPRVLDLDLLWMDGVAIKTSRLTLPHPQMHLRAFVMVPLAEVAGDLQLPGLGRVAQLAAAIDRTGIALFEP